MPDDVFTFILKTCLNGNSPNILSLRIYPNNRVPWSFWLITRIQTASNAILWFSCLWWYVSDNIKKKVTLPLTVSCLLRTRDLKFANSFESQKLGKESLIWSSGSFFEESERNFCLSIKTNFTFCCHSKISGVISTLNWSNSLSPILLIHLLVCHHLAISILCWLCWFIILSSSICHCSPPFLES